MSTRSVIAAVLLCFAWPLGAIAQIAFETPALPSIDKRDIAGPMVKAVNIAQQPDAEKLKQRVPGVKLHLDSRDGTPKWIAHTDRFLTEKDGIRGVLGDRIPTEAKASVIKTFLDEYRSLYGHGSEVLNDEDLAADITDEAGVRTFIWHQKLHGIPVFESTIRAHITKDDELISISGSMIPSPAVAAEAGTPGRAAALANPPVSPVQAIVLAAISIGESVQPSDVKPADGNPEKPQIQHFTAPQLRDKAEVEMVWLPIRRNSLKLAWHVELNGANAAYFLVVDARTGEVLVRYTRTLSSSGTESAAYKVFTSDSPRPFSPGWSTYTTAQPPATTRNTQILTSMSTSDLKGWIDDGVNETYGNNVLAYYPPSYWRTYWTFLPANPYRYFNYPLDLSGNAYTYQRASVVQAFYTCNVLHDKLYDLGWTESSKNCQLDNFGRGGHDNDAVRVYAQTVSNNAFCTPQRDGGCPSLDFGVMSNGRDNALDAEVVTHEYVHIMSSRLAGGVNAWMTDNQSKGLGEGWSDFFGISMFSEPEADNLNGNYGGNYAFGAYSTQNYYYGFRRYPYSTDMTKNPLTYKNIWTVPNYPGIPGNQAILGTDPAECHNAGEVWCVTLWDARANIIKRQGSTGNNIMMRLAILGLKLGPGLNPTYLQSRDAILSADNAYYGGIYHRQLWEAFAKRGMGYSASFGQEAFDLPPLGAQCDVPSFSPPGGCYSYNPQVTMECSTPGAIIRYTTDGSPPTGMSSPYTGPITVSLDSYIIRARALKSGMVASGERIEFYKRIDGAATPVLDPPPGTYLSPTLVSISCETQGATIRYTTDNTDPVATSPVYEGPVLVNGVAFIKAKAWATGILSSSIASGVYTIRPPKYVNSQATGTPHDGSSWDKAFLTIQNAINATTAGELWVAAGTYNERITLKDNVSLYGGFEGNETLRKQRNPLSNITTIDGGGGGITVFAPLGVTSVTTIDGFTIRNGNAYSAGGLYCYSSSPIITNNVIENNHSTGHGGGICSYKANPTIIGNTIRNNTAEFAAGIYLSDGQTVITNNIITNNTATYTGGGIECFASTPTSMDVKIVNNTIYGNTALDGGGGIHCNTNSKPAIYNNIVAFNSSGIAKEASAAPVLRNNDVFGNGSSNYSGLSAGTGDITLDPQFGNRLAGDLHIRRTSPCVNAGLNSAPSLPEIDMDRQPRVNDSVVDIGADESYGESFSLIYRVKRNSPVNGPGSNWNNAYHSVSNALTTALPGDEVWVAKGGYSGPVALKGGVALYGGFAGWEENRNYRCWRANNCILDARGVNSAITVAAGADSSTIINGFTITGGSGLSGGGIFCGDSSSPLISNNIITGNIATMGVGGGIYCAYASPTIENNIIYDNVAVVSGGGIYCEGLNAIIRYNTIHGNECTNRMGGGIGCVMAQPIIEGNIVTGNRGYGLWCDSDEPVLSYNDFHKNNDGNYYGISNPTGINGNISTDPLYIDVASDDYHLRYNSPCIDKAGSNAPAIDMDGFLRPQDGNANGSMVADIGAYEYPVDFSKIKWTSRNETSVIFSGMVVTAIIPDRALLYVEKPDRSCGIGILNTADVSEGDEVNVIGRIETNSITGERFIGTESSVSFAGRGTELGPLGLSLSRLGGSAKGLQTGVFNGVGLNNIGLLVKVWGKVVAIAPGTEPSWFTIDDGSGPIVRVEVPDGVDVDFGSLALLHPHVSVIGVSSVRATHTQKLPLVRMRKASDLQILSF